jgi:mevalonate kinase
LKSPSDSDNNVNQEATACGKIILLGEHAVVYGQPAIALPIRARRARARLIPVGLGCRIDAPEVGIRAPLDDLPEDQPLAFCIRLASERLGIPIPDGTIRIASEIPVASGLGSGAAVSCALVRLLASTAARTITPEELSSIVLEVERLYHGHPSGVDNTVIAWEQPIWFESGKPICLLPITLPMQLIIADSGIPGETKSSVAGVRERWQTEPARYQQLFDQIGSCSRVGRTALETGDLRALGTIMREDHQLLQEIGVSLPALDHLVEAATAAGALGAKLSGGGLGGHVIALADTAQETRIQAACIAAGAKSVFITSVVPA